jgi:hypothetical protein
MLNLTKLWSALGQLAANLTALAETVGEVNAGLRQRLALDGQEIPALVHQAAPDGTNGSEEGNGAASGPKRRARGTAAG